MNRVPIAVMLALATLALNYVPTTSAESCAITNPEPCEEIDAPSALTPVVGHQITYYVWMHPCYGVGVPNPPSVPPVFCDSRVVWEETNHIPGLQRTGGPNGPADTVVFF